MNTQQILENLLELLENNNVEVRKESISGGSGGLCKIKGKYTFFADTKSSSFETAVNCAKAAARIVDLDSIYIRPEVREFIEKYGDGTGGE